MEHGGSLCNAMCRYDTDQYRLGPWLGAGLRCCWATLILGRALCLRGSSTVASMGGYIYEIGNGRSKIEFHCTFHGYFMGISVLSKDEAFFMWSMDMGSMVDIGHNDVFI